MTCCSPFPVFWLLCSFRYPQKCCLRLGEDVIISLLRQVNTYSQCFVQPGVSAFLYCLVNEDKMYAMWTTLGHGSSYCSLQNLSAGLEMGFRFKTWHMVCIATSVQNVVPPVTYPFLSGIQSLLICSLTGYGTVCSLFPGDKLSCVWHQSPSIFLYQHEISGEISIPWALSFQKW